MDSVAGVKGEGGKQALLRSFSPLPKPATQATETMVKTFFDITISIIIIIIIVIIIINIIIISKGEKRPFVCIQISNVECTT